MRLLHDTFKNLKSSILDAGKLSSDPTYFFDEGDVPDGQIGLAIVVHIFGGKKAELAFVDLEIRFNGYRKHRRPFAVPSISHRSRYTSLSFAIMRQCHGSRG